MFSEKPFIKTESNFSFHVKQRTTGKVYSVFLQFFGSIDKLIKLAGNWALGYESMIFRYFLDVS